MPWKLREIGINVPSERAQWISVRSACTHLQGCFHPCCIYDHNSIQWRIQLQGQQQHQHWQWWLKFLGKITLEMFLWPENEKKKIENCFIILYFTKKAHYLYTIVICPCDLRLVSSSIVPWILVQSILILNNIDYLPKWSPFNETSIRVQKGFVWT